MQNGLDDTTVTVGSGNVFADIGVANPELALKKAQLAARIAETIRARGWTQTNAAAAMGIDQPKVSDILRGRLAAYSLDRLIDYLERLGTKVTFHFADANRLPGKRKPARTNGKLPGGTGTGLGRSKKARRNATVSRGKRPAVTRRKKVAAGD
jgi:predicted XRE-type DNA-binding protein